MNERRGVWFWFGLVLAYPTALTAAYFVLLSQAPAAWQQAVYGAGKLLQFSLPWLLLGRLPRTSPAKQGSGVWAWLVGGLFGIGVLAVILGGYYGLLAGSSGFAAAGEAVRAKVSGLGIDTPARFVALAVFYSVIHAGLEEYYWRWFAHASARTLLSPVRAVAASSLGFMAHHVLILGTFFGAGSGWTWCFSLGVAVGGACWAWLYERGGRLGPAWFGHALTDAAIFAVGYDLLQRAA